MGKCEMLNGKVIKTPNEIYPFGVLFLYSVTHSAFAQPYLIAPSTMPLMM